MAGQKIRIRLKSYDHEVIDVSARKIVETVTRAGATVVGPVPLPTEKNVYCVIRSPHKYKDSREHFEMRTHKRLIDIIDPTPKAVDSLMRLDLLGEKLGMTQVWDENNKLIPVTVVQADSNVITQLRNAETDGYVAVQIGYGQIDPRKVTKPLAGHFEKAGVTPRRHVVELRTADADSYELGQELSVELFEAGQKIDVVGTTKGKGFAGVMKRHGFHGVGASHGAHKNHRKPGSIGGASTPSRVFKGMKMAGRMGAVRHTTLNLTVHAVDVEKSLLLIKGAVPGARGQVVLVRTAVKGA